MTIHTNQKKLKERKDEGGKRMTTDRWMDGRGRRREGLHEKVVFEWGKGRNDDSQKRIE